VKSGVPQQSTLGPLAFNILINNICASIHNSHSLLFADDLKVYRSITNHIKYWPNYSVFFKCRTNASNYTYKLCNILVVHSQGTDLWILQFRTYILPSQMKRLFSVSYISYLTTTRFGRIPPSSCTCESC
jgi:hypothetical protein